MSHRMLLGWVLAAVLAGPAGAQEQAPPPARLPPPIPDEVAPRPTPLAPPPGVGLPSAPPACEKTSQSFQLHWIERSVPGQRMVLRELTTQEVRENLELGWHEESVVRTETTVKPREILKEVTTCTMKPVVKTDPATGCQSVVLEPVTEVKVIKEVVYDIVPEQKVQVVRRPYLKSDLKPVQVKRWHIDHQPEVRIERSGILVPVETRERILTPPGCAGN